ncbi:MAG: hypothetical protein COU31_04160 [Candidatus Magasanikbacteria bacterium CG10_big_fil_rev_8_21_14_0_10_40_10]|uniref:Glycosyltransferase 2-like domain-containing protein n=1 Tax=Candidatus Magasanikbacteria bacterium CG10_big_fil_rev_8_21_14_0_10_40_10 TaxID=1974648 RepID=A0A2M6W338_9BACT|nr:MAG: hypothetical protein COU31_04160 [Candidatus Magasanikbacteria bacterium CG10_big_fil_rev_8_21_14_0_10_40_10]
MKLSVNLVTYNGAGYIPFLFASLARQSFKDWKLFVADNNSTDNTVEAVKTELSNLLVQSELTRFSQNRGFAFAHNELIKKSDSQYFLVLNQDVALADDCLQKLMDFMDSQEAAVVSPRLMKWSQKNTVDSLGLKVSRSRRVVEHLSGQLWTQADEKMIALMPQSGQWSEVFGVSATCAVYRRIAVQKIALANNEIFDSSYFAYKEDVDLAWRLRQAKERAFVLLNAVAWHDRSAAAIGPTDKHAFKNKRQQSRLVRYYSYKNHLATLYKNEYWQNFLLDFPWIFCYELKKFIYCLFFDFRVLKSWFELSVDFFTLQKKRKTIKNSRQISYDQARKWIVK